MSKISELSDGGVIQGGDTLIAVRSGGNVKVTYGGSTTANIDGGTIDGTVIGGSTAAAGTFTTGQFNTSLNVDGTVTADGLTVDGDGSFSGTVPRLTLFETDLTDGNAQFLLQTRELRLGSVTDAGASFTDRFKVNVATGDVSLYDDTGTSPKFFWDASAEFVGIGTDTQTTNGESLRLINGLFINTTGTSSVPSIAIGDSNSGLFAPSAGSIAIATQGSQRLTVDDSGNILFGATSTSATEYGAKVLKDGSVSEIFAVHRQATDGDFIQFARGGNTIGSIGCGSGALTFDNSSGEAMRIDSSGHLIVPEGITLGTAVGTYNAANTLDDYEEGTFTPTYTTSGTDFSSITYDTQDGFYTKVGNMVNVRCFLRTDSITVGSASGNVLISGLPFTAANSRAVCAIQSTFFAVNYPTIGQPSGTTILLYYQTVANGTNSNALAVADLDIGANDNGIILSLTYQAT